MIQKSAVQNDGEGVEPQEFSLIAGRNAEWWSHREIPFDSLLQSEMLCYTMGMHIHKYLAKKNKNICS